MWGGSRVTAVLGAAGPSRGPAPSPAGLAPAHRLPWSLLVCVASPGPGVHRSLPEASFLPVPAAGSPHLRLQEILKPAGPPQCCWESPGLGEDGCLSHLELAISVHASLGISIFLHDFSL